MGPWKAIRGLRAAQTDAHSLSGSKILGHPPFFCLDADFLPGSVLTCRVIDPQDKDPCFMVDGFDRAEKTRFLSFCGAVHQEKNDCGHARYKDLQEVSKVE